MRPMKLSNIHTSFKVTCLCVIRKPLIKSFHNNIYYTLPHTWFKTAKQRVYIISRLDSRRTLWSCCCRDVFWVTMMSCASRSRYTDLWPANHTPTHTASLTLANIYTEWAKRTAHGFHCNNFVYSQSIFIIFGTCTLQEICNWMMHNI